MLRGNRRDSYRSPAKRFDMKKILAAMLIATMMLLALGTADDVTKSTTTATSTTPGFKATFALAGILAVAFSALRRRI
jgi:hypothetical protein